ncbi:APC family permease [Ruminococcaceae bacterium OttesenSCG-928-I18]|nr:APC family permease [Ruminococcaceae bacterium OttesenSCG-928-I18]
MASVLLFGMAMMFPVAPVAVFGEVSVASHGHFALCYIIAVIPMSFTAFSYGQMAAAYPIAGSAYSYVSNSISPYLGFLAGWAIYLDYALFPILNYIVIGIYMDVLLGIPAWISIIVAVAIVTIVNISGIKNLSLVNNFLVAFMFLVVVYFCVASFGALAGGGVGLGGFTSLPFYNPETFSWGAILAGTSIACFSFMGFDAMTTLSEEVKEPKKVLPKATVIVCFVMGAIFILQAYFAQSTFPDYNNYTDLDSAFLDAAAAAGGNLLVTFVSIAMVAGSIANAIDSQAGVARVMYGMGRDRMLPQKIFGYLHPRTQVPIYNILIVAALGIIGGLFMGLGQVVTLINFGALTAFVFVNLSVVAHYFIKNKNRGGIDVLRYLIVPLLGCLTCVVLWINLSFDSHVAGIAWLVVGVIVMAITTGGFKKKPTLTS